MRVRKLQRVVDAVRPTVKRLLDNPRNVTEMQYREACRSVQARHALLKAHGDADPGHVERLMREVKLLEEALNSPMPMDPNFVLAMRSCVHAVNNETLVQDYFM